jgi:hypothetical protein
MKQMLDIPVLNRLEVVAGTAGIQDVKALLQGTHGEASDKLRLAILYLLVAEKTPASSDLSLIETALQEAGAEVEALEYVLRMRQMNLTGPAIGGQGGTSKPGGSLLGLVDSSIVSGIAGQFGKQLTKLVGGTRNVWIVHCLRLLCVSCDE